MFKNLSASALGISGHQSEIIELALTFGFQGIDVEIPEFATRTKLHGIAYARRLIDSAHIRPGTFPLPLEWDTDDATFTKRLQKLPEYAEVAAQIGCTRCVATLAPSSEKRPYHENFEFHRHRLSAIASAMEPAGIRLGIGFRAADSLRKGQAFQFIHDLDALTLLMNMVAASNIGLLLDVWELHVGGGSIESIRTLRPGQIVAVQVANLAADVAPAEINDGARLLPAAENGLIDIPAALAVLSEMGYDGPVTPKPSRGIFKNHRRDVIVKETGESLTKVWKAAGLSTFKSPVGARS